MSFWESLRALAAESAALWGFLSAAAIVLGLAPLTARLAPVIGAVDDPAASDRPRVHSRPLPRIGGLAIVAGILVPALVFVRPDGAYLGILLGTALVAALGLVDDVRGIPPSVKLVGVSAVALIPVAGYGVYFEHVTLPLIGDHDLPLVLAYVVTVLWIAALANLVNLIDGMDALAAGIVAIAAFSFAILAASFGRTPASVLAAIVCGAAVAFLPYNYHPARIIMGDSGALALGFVLATLAVQGVMKTAATIALAAPLLVMAVPILDTSFVVLKRLKYRRPPWSPDHNHFYHRFMRIGFSQRRTAAYLHLWALMLSAYAILVRFVPPRPQGEWDGGAVVLLSLLGVLVLAASVWMAYTLEILKARHLEAVGLGRLVRAEVGAAVGPPESAEERQDTVERTVTAGYR
jgi:UDP-GlcNAc:undecaprenyl-phosphate/decaprenyl-phosphate GlcNAc-1-phosphate transferase